MILDWDEGEGGRMTGKHQASARGAEADSRAGEGAGGQRAAGR